MSLTSNSGMKWGVDRSIDSRGTAFPGGPVQLIEPFGVGGGPDLVGRQLARVLAARWGDPVTLVNYPGAGSTAGPAFVAGSPADGRTVLVSTSAHAYGAAFALDLPYDPREDFVPVAPLTNQPYVLVAGSHAGFTTLAELIWVARARLISFGSTGIGTATHVGVEVLKRELGIDAKHVPAQGEEGIIDTIDHILAGATDFAMAPIAITLPHLREGRLIALGVTTPRRSRVIPDVVALAEAGPAGFRFDFPIWYGTWVPSKTPMKVVQVLAEAIGSALVDPELVSWLTEHDADPFAMSQSEFAIFVRREADMAVRIAADG